MPARHDGKCFVDLQNDVTVADIALAAREGYQSVEHLKRYTTLGMGTDQGKTSNIIGLALLAEQLGVSIPQVGTTTFRPPYTPVTLGAHPGPRERRARRADAAIRRCTTGTSRRGARFVNAGLWKRPHSYPRPGETRGRRRQSRSAATCARNVGVVDVSTLGQDRAAGPRRRRVPQSRLLNSWDTLAVGRCRYGVMLRDDGMVMDDGTTSRLGRRRTT